MIDNALGPVSITLREQGFLKVARSGTDVSYPDDLAVPAKVVLTTKQEQHSN